MKHVTIQLTTNQAERLANILSYGEGWVQDNGNAGRSDPVNQFWERIRQRILKGLKEAA